MLYMYLACAYSCIVLFRETLSSVALVGLLVLNGEMRERTNWGVSRFALDGEEILS